MRTIIKELSWWLWILCYLGIFLVIILWLIGLIPIKEFFTIILVLIVLSLILASVAGSESELWDEVDKITFTFMKKINWDIVLSVLLVVWIIAAVINGIIKSV